MEMILSGNKKQMNMCKNALLEANGDFDVGIKNISFKRVGILDISQQLN